MNIARLALLLLLCPLASRAQLPTPMATETPAALDSPTPAPAATPEPTIVATPADVTVQISQFFKTLQRSRVDEAYDALTKNSKFASDPAELATLKKKTSEAIRLYGAIRGADVVGTVVVGTHLARVTTLSLGAELPLRWRFYFYNGASGWKLIDLRVDDRLVDLFEEKAAGTPAPEQP